MQPQLHYGQISNNSGIFSFIAYLRTGALIRGNSFTQRVLLKKKILSFTLARFYGSYIDETF